MSSPHPSSKRRAFPFDLDVGDVCLSGLLAEPEGEPTALVVALHGSGVHAAYFDGPADARLSLLELGADLGFAVWAPDRPGYGISLDVSKEHLALSGQAELMLDAIDVFTAQRAVGAGCFVVAHSYGFKLALVMAATERGDALLGIDGSGTGLRTTWEHGVSRPPVLPGDRGAVWGPPSMYPPATFERQNLPVAERAWMPGDEPPRWTEDFRRFAGRIRVPVRFTFGEAERMWDLSDEAFAELKALLAASPRVEVELQRGAGHNVSLSNTGRAYHLKALAFAEESVSDRRAESTVTS